MPPPSAPPQGPPRRRLHSVILIETMPAPRRALTTSCRAQKYGLVMSVTTQIIFSHMSDARAPAMDTQMATQGPAMARSFCPILSAILIGDDVYISIHPPCSTRVHRRKLNI